jgi:hypothetical protein
MGPKSISSTLRSAIKDKSKEPEVPVSKPTTTTAPAAPHGTAMGKETTSTAGPSGLPLASGTTGMSPFSFSEQPRESISELLEQGRELAEQDPEESHQESDRENSQAVIAARMTRLEDTIHALAAQLTAKEEPSSRRTREAYTPFSETSRRRADLPTGPRRVNNPRGNDEEEESSSESNSDSAREADNKLAERRKQSAKLAVKIPFFYGDSSKKNELRAFLRIIETVILFQREALRSDEDKVLFASSYFRDGALEWVGTYQDLPYKKRPSWLRNWKEFVEELKDQYGDHHEEEHATEKLLDIRQTNKETVAEYLRRFVTLATQVRDFPDKALANICYKGIRRNLKEAIIHTYGRPPTSMKALKIAALDAEYSLQHLEEDKETTPGQERKSDGQRRAKTEASGTGQRTTDGPRANDGARDASSANVKKEVTAFPTKQRRERTPEEEAERKRRYELDLCLDCGKAGHKVIDCPVRRARREAAAAAAAAKAELEKVAVKHVQIKERHEDRDSSDEEDSDEELGNLSKNG